MVDNDNSVVRYNKVSMLSDAIKNTKANKVQVKFKLSVRKKLERIVKNLGYKYTIDEDWASSGKL